MTVVSVGSQVTPNHVHSVPLGPSQFVLVDHAAPLVEVYSVTSAVRSESGMAAAQGAATQHNTAAKATRHRQAFMSDLRTRTERAPRRD